MSTYTDFMCKSLVQTVLIENKSKVVSENFAITFLDNDNKTVSEMRTLKTNLEVTLSNIFSERTHLDETKHIVISCITDDDKFNEITTIEIN